MLRHDRHQARHSAYGALLAGACDWPELAAGLRQPAAADAPEWVSEEVAAALGECDAPSLERLTSTALVLSSRSGGAEAGPVRAAAHASGIDCSLVDVEHEDCSHPLLVYAGGERLSAVAQRALLHHVERGAQLALFAPGPLRDERGRPLDVLGIGGRSGTAIRGRGRVMTLDAAPTPRLFRALHDRTGVRPPVRPRSFGVCAALMRRRSELVLIAINHDVEPVVETFALDPALVPAGRNLLIYAARQRSEAVDVGADGELSLAIPARDGVIVRIQRAPALPDPAALSSRPGYVVRATGGQVCASERR
ncbi:MAG TPA: hypothetical protein VFF79_14855 [Conexibacter sp.]|jgi:hypothetical protein|nr:hypothetical protein [Conexibacter sp.]